ncbi:MAG: hypothetical protein J0L52_03590 [Caulobacterales bacterium]|nr:hypothetical protein [Caulobacterales bacterium]
MRRLAYLAVLLCLSACQADKAEQERVRSEDAVLTGGGPIDCTADLSEAAQVVCADTDLRALDRQIAERWVEVERVTGRPNTLRQRHVDWLADREAGERQWDSEGRRQRTVDELEEFQQAYLGTLTEELRLAAAVPQNTPVAALAGGCIGTALSGCTAPSAGYVNGPNGHRLAWQIQQGSTDYAGVSAGVILFRIDGDLLHPIGWSFEAGSFQAPEMFEQSGRIFVAAEGYQVGTGSQNADVLFRLDGERWTEIEIESWKSALAEALPDGLGVWKGVDYAWPEMMAFSSLWRPDDANCCPTGGEAVIDLRADGTALRLVGVTPQRTTG